MGRPEFTSPVERPNDAAGLRGDASFEPLSLTVGSGSADQGDLYVNNSGSPDYVEMFMVDSTVESHTAQVIFQVEDAGGNIIAQARGNMQNFPISPTTPYRLPDGGKITVAVQNRDGGSQHTYVLSVQKRDS